MFELARYAFQWLHIVHLHDSTWHCIPTNHYLNKQTWPITLLTASISFNFKLQCHAYMREVKKTLSYEKRDEKSAHLQAILCCTSMRNTKAASLCMCISWKRRKAKILEVSLSLDLHLPSLHKKFSWKVKIKLFLGSFWGASDFRKCE